MIRAAILAFCIVGMLNPYTAFAKAPAEVVLSIEDVVARHEALDGRTVTVSGWMSSCLPLSCGIATHPDQSGAFLSLGSSHTFDKSVARFRGRNMQIYVAGAVAKECFDHTREAGSDGTISVCTDRADKLRNPKLLRILQVRSLPVEE